MTRFLDLLDLASLLSDEERLGRDTVRRFARDRIVPIVPNIADWFEEGVFPRELVKEMGALELLGMHLTGYMCAKASAVDYGLACMELEAADSRFRSFVSV